MFYVLKFGDLPLIYTRTGLVRAPQGLMLLSQSKNRKRHRQSERKVNALRANIAPKWSKLYNPKISHEYTYERIICVHIGVYIGPLAALST